MNFNYWRPAGMFEALMFLYDNPKVTAKTLEKGAFRSPDTYNKKTLILEEDGYIYRFFDKNQKKLVWDLTDKGKKAAKIFRSCEEFHKHS